MKPLTFFSTMTFYGWSLLNSLLALAQSDGYYQSKGHWQVRTDAISHTTVVTFYDAYHHPIYQETLPGQHIRLSRKNIRRLDAIGAHLTTRQLVASAVRSDELPPNPAPIRSEFAADPTAFSAEPDTAFGGFRTKVIPVAPNHLTVYYVQADTEPVSIQLLDQSGQPVHREVHHVAKYKRSFDLEQLNPGLYELALSTARYRYIYRLRLPAPNDLNRPVVLSVFDGPTQPKTRTAPRPVTLQ
ncbi:hypothetical protein ACFQ4C_12640 [Larkinella insperata]|uniref:Uncharacterized protein n=1 Tax=Larkinella insperata TaxID=332158 RepID=A0ABW3QAL5_9BACT|nr:hypothetical protein [Larkinella insperata]